MWFSIRCWCRLGSCPPLCEVLTPQRPFPGAQQRPRAAGGIHQIKTGQLICAAPGKARRRQRAQQLRNFRPGVVRRPFLPVGYDALPQFAGKVVDMLGVQGIQLHAEVMQQFQYTPRIRLHYPGVEGVNRQLNHRQIVNSGDDAPLLQDILGSQTTQYRRLFQPVGRLQIAALQVGAVPGQVVLQVNGNQPDGAGGNGGLMVGSASSVPAQGGQRWGGGGG